MIHSMSWSKYIFELKCVTNTYIKSITIGNILDWNQKAVA